ncbi:HGxxPAAW family protein [Yinghuangia soli]|uniref:Uncharacterized protein n=1 Tax=Yinghuangia soli TaxID=2908204 RepID=A0AA41PZH4_9ACTN|nr:HGxxPAAW family protein [Yinghuangia soli]MCF2528784.1 hypothetical protein [Yinghuangia soli]
MSYDPHAKAQRRYGRRDMRIDNAGHSPAAWIGVAVILAGCLMAAIAFPTTEVWLFWTGVGVAVVGAFLGKILSLMGLGIPPGYHQEGDVELRDRFVDEGRGGRRSG